ncbi:MAG: hypothetical protein IJB74_04215 [Clostridia bacterium]|nr:hypothetical protein [Clostridia bacterium]
MKRIICLFLASVVCLSFSACGKISVEADSEVNTTAFAIDENGSADFTEEQLVKYIEKVELTTENRMLYFEDYCREKAVERVNSFGEVTHGKELHNQRIPKGDEYSM